MSQFTVAAPGKASPEKDTDAVTIGEALEAAGATPSTGSKPVDLADAAALESAEMRATGLAGVLSGGVAARAQKAADVNMRRPRHDDGGGEDQCMTLISDVADGATLALPYDKVATREDAGKVAAVATRNAGDGGKGVAQAMAAAAEMNEGRMD
uniref:SMP domain-containing protein n=1 Tax=Leersia perrieri TaxID=77586 RepID=A0A0D9Y1J7_9ORYZ